MVCDLTKFRNNPPGLIGFMERLAELTAGRVFLMDDRELGSFVLRDFVRRRAS